MPRNPTPVLFLDLDATVRHGRDELGRFVNTAQDVEVFPAAITRMRDWKTSGGRLAGCSNQGGIALGYLTEEDCRAAVQRTNELTGGLFDALIWCAHHPAAPDPVQASCWCRKPMPGLVYRALGKLTADNHPEFYPPHLALFVGDRAEDEECARRAGIEFMWADHWRVGKGLI